MSSLEEQLHPFDEMERITLYVRITLHVMGFVLNSLLLFIWFRAKDANDFSVFIIAINLLSGLLHFPLLFAVAASDGFHESGLSVGCVHVDGRSYSIILHQCVYNIALRCHCEKVLLENRLHMLGAVVCMSLVFAAISSLPIITGDDYAK
jgi:hypothetical protein